MPEVRKKVKAVRKVKTLRVRRGLGYLKTRPRTMNDRIYNQFSVRTIKNIPSKGLANGIRNIHSIGKKPWELELAESMHIRAKQVRDKASRIYDTLNSVNAAMTEIKKREQELQSFTEDLQNTNEGLQATNEEVERIGKQMREFASVASHELQEPLRMVGSYLQLIEKRYLSKLDIKGKEFMEFAVDGAKRMQTLIDDLLNYSRLTTCPKVFGPANCENVLKQVLSDMQITVKKSGAVITHDSLPVIMGYDLQIGQLFQNLISNGIKFHREKQLPIIHISVEQKEQEWVLSVQDNGIGIAPEYHQRIFKIFQRLHGKHEYSGTGIGLAICQNIVQNHNGRIWLESIVGEGTTFRFTIPVEKMEEGVAEHEE